MVMGSVTNMTGQDNPSKSSSTPAKVSKKVRKKQWQRQREIERANRKALKTHWKDQTKVVRRGMKKNARTARRNNVRG